MIYKLDDIFELQIKNPSWEVVQIDRSIVIIKMSIGSPNNNSVSVTFPLCGYDGSEIKSWVTTKLKEYEV